MSGKIRDTAAAELTNVELNRRQRGEVMSEEQVNFLGGGKMVEIPVVARCYYADLLSWVTQTHIQEQGWEILRLEGSRDNPEPRYRSASMGPGILVDVLVNGMMFLQRGETRLVCQVWMYRRTMVVVCCNERDKAEAKQFTRDIRRLMVERNPYHGGKITYAGRIRFMEVKHQEWDDVVMDEKLKEEVRFNTVGFLSHAGELARYGIPAKRGIILDGVPGTGKTLLTRVLMNHSPGVTCIEADTSILSNPGYVETLYDLAAELRPSIVFLEDLNLIGTDRFDGGNPRESGLVALLAALDGIENCEGVVTVATSNNARMLDRAVRQRPQRFDLIISMELPGHEDRRNLLYRLGRRIPVEERLLDYIAEATSGFSPAQLQEVLYSMVIRRHNTSVVDTGKPMEFTPSDVDYAINLISHDKKSGLGFRQLDTAAGPGQPGGLLN